MKQKLTLEHVLAANLSAGEQHLQAPGIETDVPASIMTERDDADFSGMVPLWSQRRETKGWHETCLRLEDMIDRREDFSASKMDQATYEYILKHAYGTDDFPLAFGDIIDRRLKARYMSLGRVLDPLFVIGTNRDFKTANIFRMQGTTKRLQQVGEFGEYLEAARYETRWQIKLNKYGKSFQMSWEAFLNDDLGIFDGVPTDMADSAINTEAWLQTSTFWDADGPLDAYFADADEGQGGVSSNTLTIANVQSGVAALRVTTTNMRNYQGEPIMKRPRYLVVNPSHEYDARQILESSEVRWAGAGAGSSDTAKYQTGTKNIANTLNLDLIVDDWLAVVCTTGTIGATTWGIFCDNIKGGEFRRLAGHEAPELFMRLPNAVRVGGGAVTPFDGSFTDDSIAYKVRHCAATTTTDMRAGWASDGQ